MARLTNVQRSRINRALAHAVAARDYIMSDQVVVAHRDSMATTTLHYTRSDGSTLYPVTREYGSNLCRIDSAIHELESLLVD